MRKVLITGRVIGLKSLAFWAIICLRLNDYE